MCVDNITVTFYFPWFFTDVGDLYVWGWNESGQLGLSANKENVLTNSIVNVQTEPQYVHFSEECCMKSVACGSRHTVILLG